MKSISGIKPYGALYGMEHGTIHAYTRKGCTCDDCRDAWALYHRNRRHKYWPPSSLEHGKFSTYVNYRCREPLCMAAAQERRRAARTVAA